MVSLGPSDLIFFKKPSEICVLLSTELAGKNNWPVLNDIPHDASNVEPVLLLDLCRNVFLNVRQLSARPTAFDLNRILEVTSLK